MTYKELEEKNAIIDEFYDPNSKFNLVDNIYYNDWRLLIGVFQKIEKLGYNWNISDEEVEISESGYQWITHSRETVDKGGHTTLINAAFKCAANFIEQYNNNSLKQATK